MKSHMFDKGSTAYLMNLSDGKKAVVLERTLRDELIKSRLASPHFTEIPTYVWKSRYAVKENPSV